MARLSSDGTKILDNYDRFTGIPFNASIVTVDENGDPMDDSKVDNVVYFKNRTELGGGYAKRDFLPNEKLNLLSFGVRPDSGLDDTEAMIASTRYKNIAIPKGLIKVTKPIIYKSGTILRGEGVGESIIDASEANPSDFTSTGAVLTILGETPVLVGVTSTIPKVNDGKLTFGEDMSISQGDILMVCDPTDYSFSKFRDYYKEGEIVYAKNNSTGSEVTLKGRLVGDRYVANCNIYKMQKNKVELSGLTVISMNTGAIACVNIQYLTSGYVNSLQTLNSNYAGLLINKCVNLKISNSFLNKDNTDSTNTSYGIVFSNSQNINSDFVNASSSRHAYTTGGAPGDFTITNRFLAATNCTFMSANGQGVGAYDLHGNAEYCHANNCTIIGGATLRGRRSGLDNCDVFQDPDGNNAAIYLSEVLEASFTINNCRIKSYQTIGTSSGVWVQITPNNDTETRGVLKISNCTFTWDNKLNATTEITGIRCNYSTAGDNLFEFDINNNNFINNDTTKTLVAIRISTSTFEGNEYKILKYVNNTFQNCYNFINRSLKVICNNNVYNKSDLYADFFSLCSNVFYNGNILISPNSSDIGSSANKSGVVFSSCSKVYISGNKIQCGTFSNYGINYTTVSEINNMKNSIQGALVRNFLLSSSTTINGYFEYTGTPEGVYTANIGSTYIQINGATGSVMWIKETDSGNTGWHSLQGIRSGTTAQRPTSIKVGYEYFDTTIGYPVWWNGTVWVNSVQSATTSIKGVVNQSAAVASVGAADSTSAAISSAADISALVVDFNILVSQYNIAVTEINEVKDKLNAKLAADRTSGQQAT